MACILWLRWSSFLTSHHLIVTKILVIHRCCENRELWILSPAKLARLRIMTVPVKKHVFLNKGITEFRKFTHFLFIRLSFPCQTLTNFAAIWLLHHHWELKMNPHETWLILHVDSNEQPNPPEISIYEDITVQVVGFGTLLWLHHSLHDVWLDLFHIQSKLSVLAFKK